MTIETEVRIAGPYSTNGATTAFAFSFKVFETTDVVVTQRTTATLADDVLVENTDYTIALNADQDASPGGTVTISPAKASGFTITITSEIPVTQSTELTSGGGFFPKIIEDAFDRLTAISQELAAKVARSMVAPLSEDAIGALPDETTRASKFLAFDASGVPMASSGVSSVPVSAASETLLQAINVYDWKINLQITAVSNGFALTSCTELKIVDDASDGVQVYFTSAITTDSTRAFKGVIYPGATMTADLSTAGLGGLDTGTKANNTWYYLYVIQREVFSMSAHSLIFSTKSPLHDDSDITYPSTYSVKGFLGAFRTDGSGDIINAVQLDRCVACSTGTALSAGTATTAAAIDLNNYVPAGAQKVVLKISVSRASGSAAETTTLYVNSEFTPVAEFNIPASATVAAQIFTVTVPIDNISYAARRLSYKNANSTGRTSLEVLGWEY